MKIAVTCTGSDIEAPLDPRFGRAAGFMLYDTETGDTTYLANAQNVNAAQGAGIQAAQNVVAAGTHAVVTGHCGPKAFRVLSASGVTVYTGVAGTVGEALAKFRRGELSGAATPDVEGHWV